MSVSSWWESSPEEASEEAGTAGSCRGDLVRGVGAVAPFPSGNRAAHRVDVLAAPRPGCFFTDAARGGTTHGFLELSFSEPYTLGGIWWNYTPGGTIGVNCTGGRRPETEKRCRKNSAGASARWWRAATPRRR